MHEMSHYQWSYVNYGKEFILPDQYPNMNQHYTSGMPYPFMFPGQKNNLTGESIVRRPVVYPDPSMTSACVISYRGQHYKCT